MSQRMQGEEPSQEELREMARQQHIQGYSTMNKEELKQALGQGGGKKASGHSGDGGGKGSSRSGDGGGDGGSRRADGGGDGGSRHADSRGDGERRSH